MGQSRNNPRRYARKCQNCGFEYVAATPAGKYCSANCRTRAHQKRQSAGTVTAIREEPAERTDMRDATRRELEDAGRLTTSAGTAAMLAAERVDKSGMHDTGAGFAAALRAHREAMVEALRDPDQKKTSALEELRRSAALKLVRGA